MNIDPATIAQLTDALRALRMASADTHTDFIALGKRLDVLIAFYKLEVAPAAYG